MELCGWFRFESKLQVEFSRRPLLLVPVWPAWPDWRSNTARRSLCACRERHAAVERFRAFAKIADECEEWLIPQFYPHQTRSMQIK